VILEILGGDKDAYEEFLRFKDKKAEKEMRLNIEDRTNEILDHEMKREYQDALDIVDKVYRKAWEMACEDLDMNVEEFPSKY